MEPKEIREYAKELGAWIAHSNLTMQKAAELDAKHGAEDAKLAEKIREYAKELNTWIVKASVTMEKAAK